MQEITVKLIARVRRTDSVESFRFMTEQPLAFIPGQFCQVLFDPANRTNRALNKYLSFSCSPAQPYIEVTKRLSDSDFSARLRALSPGDSVLLKGPLGECTFQESYQHVVFLIGGIGITPAISIIEHIVERNLGTRIDLFYSNRTVAEIAFRAELDAWRGKYPPLRLHYLVTDCQPQDTTCAFGYIDKNSIGVSSCQLPESVVFIYGPPKMVDAMAQLAGELSCRKENIKTERFIGY